MTKTVLFIRNSAAGTNNESDGTTADNAILVKEANGEDPIDWINLEDGVQIQFPKTAGNSYRAGDYWMVPARVATGDVLWPRKLERESISCESSASPWN